MTDQERRDVIEECIQWLEGNWKSFSSRGDQRGDDMAYGVHIAIEGIRALAPPEQTREPESRGEVEK